jgi:hypothetical protein
MTPASLIQGAARIGPNAAIGDDVRPGTEATERCNAVLQRSLQHHCEEAAEHCFKTEAGVLAKDCTVVPSSPPAK